jgi:hypothetical protein
VQQQTGLFGWMGIAWNQMRPINIRITITITTRPSIPEGP